MCCIDARKRKKRGLHTRPGLNTSEKKSESGSEFKFHRSTRLTPRAQYSGYGLGGAAPGGNCGTPPVGLAAVGLALAYTLPLEYLFVGAWLDGLLAKHKRPAAAAADRAA